MNDGCQQLGCYLAIVAVAVGLLVAGWFGGRWLVNF